MDEKVKEKMCKRTEKKKKTWVKLFLHWQCLWLLLSMHWMHIA